MRIDREDSGRGDIDIEIGEGGVRGGGREEGSSEEDENESETKSYPY